MCGHGSGTGGLLDHAGEARGNKTKIKTKPRQALLIGTKGRQEGA